MPDRITIFNGKQRSGKRKTSGHGPKKKKNGMSFLFNGAKHMSNKKKKRKSHGPNTHRSTRRFKSRGSHGPKKGARRNAGFRERTGGTAEFLISAGVTALLPGLLLENFAPQWNSGIIGYVVEGAAGLGLSWLGGRFFGRRTFDGGLAGTVAALSIRGAQDLRATPVKAVAANVRDAQANAPSVSGMGRMGTTVQWPFPQPQIYAQGPGPVGPPALPPMPTGGMNGMGRMPGRTIGQRRYR